tara:strand:+ start:2003 stop:2203 length:201 start_codon:yes stop_codon:yes gene_type:complete
MVEEYENLVNYAIDNEKSMIESMCDLIDKRIETLEEEIAELKKNINNDIDDICFSGEEASYKHFGE